MLRSIAKVHTVDNIIAWDDKVTDVTDVCKLYQ